MYKQCIIYDKEDKLTEIQALFPDGEYIPFKKGFSSSAAFLRNSDVVFYIANKLLGEVTAECKNTLNKHFFVFPYDVDSLSGPIEIDNTKPRLSYMETEIYHKCNLNCKGCSGFLNIAVDECCYDYEVFSRDLLRLKELFWGVEIIRLMGGEPLLNPQLADYVEKVRYVFPDCDLRIVTNGLLVSSLSEETLHRIKSCGGSFDVSFYPPTRKKKQEIKKHLQKTGIAFRFSIPMLFFFKTLLEHPQPDGTAAFRNCLFSHCHMLGNGFLAPCSYAYCAYRFNAHFNSVFPENDRIDLYAENLDGWKIDTMLKQPHEFCRYCGCGMVPFLWHGGVSRYQAKKSDWLINESFLTMRVLPIIQRMIKPGARRLRFLIQKRK